MQHLNPRESGEHIVKHAKDVKVKEEGIQNLAEEVIAGLLDGRISVENFSQHDLHPKSSDSHAIEWIFVVDTLNFCFWTKTDYTKYKVKGYTGYFALCAAINRAMEEGLDITNAEFYSKIDKETLSKIFQSDDGESEVPLLERRLDCLHEVGRVLLDKWNGKFENIVKAANRSAEKLLYIVTQEFPCYQDEADYAGARVSLYKRAQILIGDLWACFRSKDWGEFTDIQSITMFADYRIPQVLIHFGCMEYSKELMQRLKKDEILKNGEPMEVEIRGASIYVVEKVKEAVLKNIEEKYLELSKINVNSILLDHFLWDYRRKNAKELDHIPFHKTYSVFY